MERSPSLAARMAQQPCMGVKRQMFRMDDEHAHLADAAFAAVRAQVLERDAHACQFCDLRAEKWQEVHHKDNDHHHNSPDNLLTVCNLCHQVHHVFLAGINRAAFVASLPELTQTEVNQICRAIFVAEILGPRPEVDKLGSLYALFEARGDALKHAFGGDVRSPLLLGEALSRASEGAYERRGEALGALRLVPTRQAFRPGQLEYYATQPGQFSPRRWPSLARVLEGA